MSYNSKSYTRMIICVIVLLLLLGFVKHYCKEVKAEVQQIEHTP